MSEPAVAFGSEVVCQGSVTPEPLEALPLETDSVAPSLGHPYWAQLPGERASMYEALRVMPYKRHVIDPARRLVTLPSEPSEQETSGYPTSGDRETNLWEIIRRTKRDEKGHLYALGLYTALGSIAAATIPSLRDAIIGLTVAANVTVNVYPIMLQRYNRIRAFRILEHIHRTKTYTPLEKSESSSDATPPVPRAEE